MQFSKKRTRCDHDDEVEIPTFVAMFSRVSSAWRVDVDYRLRCWARRLSGGRTFDGERYSHSGDPDCAARALHTVSGSPVAFNATCARTRCICSSVVYFTRDRWPIARASSSATWCLCVCMRLPRVADDTMVVASITPHRVPQHERTHIHRTCKRPTFWFDIITFVNARKTHHTV